MAVDCRSVTNLVEAWNPARTRDVRSDGGNMSTLRLCSLPLAVMVCLALSGGVRGVPAPGMPGSLTPQTNRNEVESRYLATTAGYERAFDDFEKTASLDQPFRYDLSSLATFLETQMRDAANPDDRGLAAVYLAMMAGYEVKLPEDCYRQIVKRVSVTSSLWNKSPDSIRYISENLSPAEAHSFLRSIAENNPDREIQARALIAMAKLSIRQHDPAAYRKTYGRLVSGYKEVKAVQFDIALLNPSNQTAIGKKVAPFILPSIDGAEPYSNTNLVGRYYLLDFWATWCGPCLGERSGLMRAYQRFEGKNFTILSVSLDKNPNAVKRFRATRWNMPWKNLFLPGGQDSKTAHEYDLDWIGLPHTLWSGPTAPYSLCETN